MAVEAEIKKKKTVRTTRGPTFQTKLHARGCDGPCLLLTGYRLLQGKRAFNRTQLSNILIALWQMFTRWSYQTVAKFSHVFEASL